LNNLAASLTRVRETIFGALLAVFISPHSSALTPAVSHLSFWSEVSRLFWLATRSRFWRFCVDLYPILVAASLPWSTTAVIVFLIIWFIVLIPTIELTAFARSMRKPASLVPIIFFGLAVVGMLWADGSWSIRFQGLGPVAKLLVLPFLLYHFGRSTRPNWVLIAFLSSCTLLLAYSWIIYVAPALRFSTAHGFDTTGVPVRNAIDQNQEFALCLFILASLTLTALGRQRFAIAATLGLLAAAFLGNIMFVALARTSLAYIIPLAVIFVFRHFNKRTTLFVLMGVAVTMVIVWSGSPYLRGRVEHIAIEYKEYRETNRPTSTGQRLAYWAESLSWIREAPVMGHGTGSTKQLFDSASAGKEGAWAESIGNPHNQTLYVAIQWGLVGCIILYTMWYFHYGLFSSVGLVAWVGLVVVIQNVISSLLNSHLFDFSEGWMYVLGVGVAGGLLHRSHHCQSSSRPFGPLVPDGCTGASAERLYLPRNSANGKGS
jgi:O-antigen ligase